MTNIDVEKIRLPFTPVVDFPSLAGFIASDEDKSPSIYRRFERLSARNLLQLQSELIELEAQQDENDAEIAGLGVDAKKSLRNWSVLRKQALQSNNVNDVKALFLAKEIREKLKEYKEALLLDSQILSLSNPSKKSYEAFYSIFHHTGRGETKKYPALGGRDQLLLDDPNDLVALGKPVKDDPLTTFFRHRLPFLFEQKKVSGYQNIVYLSEKRIQSVVGFINALLAAALLFGAIYNLYYVTNPNTRLGLIAGYTTAFALYLAVFTNAKQSEIFGACATYAAVLVVFVSGGLGSN